MTKLIFDALLFADEILNKGEDLYEDGSKKRKPGLRSAC